MKCKVLSSHHVGIELLDPSQLSLSYSTTIKCSNYLFYGRSSMPFILRMNNRDKAQKYFLYSTQCRLLRNITTFYFFFNLKHVFLLISKPLPCNGSFVCKLHFKPVVRELLSYTCCRYLFASISSAFNPLSGCLPLIVRKFPGVSPCISKYLEGNFQSFDCFNHPAQT